MNKYVIAIIAMCLVGMSLAEEDPQLHYTLISPPAYVGDWQAYLDMRKTQRPDVDFKLVDAADIYAAYPFDPAATDGAPRNPAESIHAWIRAKMRGITDPTERAKYYFVLGGSFTDAQTITATDDARLQKYMPGVYVRPRFSPDDNIQVGEPYYSISDMFYACLDVKDGEWPWDANKNGKYADNQESGTNLNDYIADVVVARIPVEKHPSGAKEVISAFKKKVARVENPAFAGCYRFALAGGQCSNKGGRVNITDGNTLRDEYEFYDGGLNMFDPRHGGMWIDSELVPRRTVKNTTVMKRPVLEGNPMFMYTWGADHATIEDAVEHFYSHDYDYLEYRDHGSASDLYCKYINADAYLKATGLTRMIISGFSCMTGYIDGPGVSLAEAEILSPGGGTVASVHNSRYGVNWAGTDLKDNAGLSSTLQYLTKQGVLEKNMDLGQAWLYARQQFGATADLALFVSAEQLLLGDPLIKLSPPVLEKTLDETEIAVTEDTGYTTLNVKGGTTIAGQKLFKVMQGLNVTSYGNLTFAADGGVGGSGVSFANGEGTLTIASPSKSYFVQPTGAREVVIAGNGTTLDFEQGMPKFEALTLRGEGETRRTGNVLRGRAEGQLKGFVPFAVENTEVAFGTVDAFQGASENLATVKNGGLGITFNPNYGLENSWEYFTGSINLDNGTLFVDRTETAGFGRDKTGLAVSVKGETSVETRNGGKATLFGTTSFALDDAATLTLDATFAPDAATNGKLVVSGGRTVVADGYGLAGEVEVNDGTLVLNEIPLRNVTKLTLNGSSKLVIPMDDGGYSQVLSAKGASLEISDDTQVFTLDDEETPIEGKVSSNGVCFDLSKFMVWDGNDGNGWTAEWMDGKKVYFPEIEEGGEVIVNIPNELSCAFIAFGNENGTYRFKGARINLGSAVLSENVVFENEVYVATSTLVSGKESQFATLITPSLQIQDGAVVSAMNIANEIKIIKGIRFYPLKTNGGDGKSVALLELTVQTNGADISLKQAAFSYPTDLGSVSNPGALTDGTVLSIFEAIQGTSESCHITANSQDILNSGQFYLQYLFDTPIAMPTSFSLAATAVAGENASQSLTAFRVDVTSDGVNWVTAGEASNVQVPKPGPSNMWYGGSQSPTRFSLSTPATDIIVAVGGSLELAGSVSGTVHLAAESKLKVGAGAMTLGTGSKIVVPETGYAIIDVSDLELENIGEEGLTVLSGITLTEDELAHLTTRGQSYYNLIVEGDALKLVIHKKPPRVLFK